jgi:hypothetical protein
MSNAPTPLTIPKVWKLLDAARWMRDNNIPRCDGMSHDEYIASLQKIISDKCDEVDRLFNRNAA